MKERKRKRSLAPLGAGGRRKERENPQVPQSVPNFYSGRASLTKIESMHAKSEIKVNCDFDFNKYMVPFTQKANAGCRAVKLKNRKVYRCA